MHLRHMIMQIAMQNSWLMLFVGLVQVVNMSKAYIEEGKADNLQEEGLLKSMTNLS